jgi:hypothetical protein
MIRLFCGLPVTAEQLRDDRIVEEALSAEATRCTWRPCSASVPAPGFVTPAPPATPENPRTRTHPRGQPLP